MDETKKGQPPVYQTSDKEKNQVIENTSLHLISDLNAIQLLLEKARNEAEIESLSQRYQRVVKIAVDRLGERENVNTDAAQDFWAAWERFSFEKKADERRSESDFQKVSPISEPLPPAVAGGSGNGGESKKISKPVETKKSRGEIIEREEEASDKVLELRAQLEELGVDWKRAGKNPKQLQKLLDRTLRARETPPPEELPVAPVVIEKPEATETILVSSPVAEIKPEPPVEIATNQEPASSAINVAPDKAKTGTVIFSNRLATRPGDRIFEQKPSVVPPNAQRLEKKPGAASPGKAREGLISNGEVGPTHRAMEKGGESGNRAVFEENKSKLEKYYEALIPRTNDPQLRAQHQRSLDRLRAITFPINRPPKRENIREAPKAPDIRKSEAFRFLDKQFLRGMSAREMDALFGQGRPPAFVPEPIRPKLAKAYEAYKADLARGYDPLARLSTEIVKKFVGNYNELNAEDQKQADEKFKDLARNLWKDFVYSSRLVDGQPSANPKDWDNDVKVSLWLGKKAGLKAIADAEPVAKGARVPGKSHLDTFGASGAGMEFVSGEPTVYADNHQTGREYRTSSAKIFYELLKHAGLLDELDHREQSAINMMVRLTVDTDNAVFPGKTREEQIKYFENSHKTLLGLGHALSADQLHDYFLRNGVEYGGKAKFSEKYTHALAEHAFTDEEIRKYGLNSPENMIKLHGKQIYLWDARLENIQQAKELLTRDRKELFAEGRIVETKFGTYVADIVQGAKDKLRAGHTGAQVYGYDGYLSYDVRTHSFIVNSLRDNVDLSKDAALQQIQKRNGEGVFVRGSIFISSAKTEPLRTSLRSFLQAVCGDKFQAQGRIAEALAAEDRGELKSVQALQAAKSGKKKGGTAKPLEAPRFVASIPNALLSAEGLSQSVAEESDVLGLDKLVPNNIDDETDAKVRADLENLFQRIASSDQPEGKLEGPINEQAVQAVTDTEAEKKQTEREKLIAEIENDVREELEKLFGDDYTPAERQTMIKIMLPKQVAEVIKLLGKE